MLALVSATQASADTPSPDGSSEPESLLVTLDTGDRIHYLDWGGPPAGTARLPPLVLIHGLLGTAWTWAPVARLLRDETRVIALDLRGHGLSDAPRDGYDLESLGYDVLTVLVGNGWGTGAGGPPAVIAGHGLGGIVAASTAALEPASVAGLGLVDGGWEELEEATGQSPGVFLQSLAEPPEVLRSMEGYLEDRRAYDPETWDRDQERAARSAVDEKAAGHVVPVVRRHALRAIVEALFEYRPREVLVPLEMPLLVAIAGSAGGGDEEARERELALEDILRDRRDAGREAPRIARFRGVGHNLMRYRPAQLCAELSELLEAAARYQRL